MRFQDKTAIVTGATSGIGEAVAERLADEGASLLICGRNAARGEAVASRLTDKGARVIFHRADLTERGAPDQLATLARKSFERLDVLVNNAGILFRGSALRCTDEEWDATIATNVTAVFRVSRAILRLMVAQRSGAIVNIASDWALVGAQNAVAYGVSKGAVAQLTRSMAIDHARDGIRVNAVCPGDTDTPMLDGAMQTADRDRGLAALGAAIPLGRVATPAEIAAAVAFLASDDASFMTGALMAVDGGNSAQ
ncbi:MAG: SDR family NAD(P)-dependent oxidoreductase [Dongiaceae bacterium]